MEGAPSKARRKPSTVKISGRGAPSLTIATSRRIPYVARPSGRIFRISARLSRTEFGIKRTFALAPARILCRNAEAGTCCTLTRWSVAFSNCGTSASSRSFGALPLRTRISAAFAAAGSWKIQTASVNKTRFMCVSSSPGPASTAKEAAGTRLSHDFRAASCPAGRVSRRPKVLCSGYETFYSPRR